MTEPIYRLDRSKRIILTSILNTLFDPDIASVVRPWLEVTNTETGTGVVWQQVQLVSVVLSHWWGVVETLCSHWLISQDGFETQSVENLCPPNRKNKKRTKRRAVERFKASYQERAMRNK